MHHLTGTQHSYAHSYTSYTHALIHSYTHTLIHSYINTLIHSYTSTYHQLFHSLRLWAMLHHMHPTAYVSLAKRMKRVSEWMKKEVENVEVYPQWIEGLCIGAWRHQQWLCNGASHTCWPKIYKYECMHVCMRVCVCVCASVCVCMRNKYIFNEKRSHSYSLTYSLTLTYWLTDLFAHSLFTYSLTHLLTYSLNHLLTTSFSLTLNPLLAYPLARLLTGLPTYSLIPSLPSSLPITHSFITLTKCWYLCANILDQYDCEFNGSCWAYIPKHMYMHIHMKSIVLVRTRCNIWSM